MSELVPFYGDWARKAHKLMADTWAPSKAPKPFYVKWDIANRTVVDVNTFAWPEADTDAYIHYREPNPGDHVWYAYASRTLIGRKVQPDQVPAEVRLAVELLK